MSNDERAETIKRLANALDDLDAVSRRYKSLGYMNTSLMEASFFGRDEVAECLLDLLPKEGRREALVRMFGLSPHNEAPCNS